MSNNEVIKENKMGVMNTNKLLVSMSLPIILSMLVQALYNIVDSIFVAKISEDALTAVSMAFPIQSLMIAFAAGTGVGINALLSRSLGEHNFKRANESGRNGIFLAIITWIVFAVLGFFFSRFFYTVQIDNPTIIGYGADYLSIVTVASLGIFMQITFERLLQSTGKTMLSMYMQGTGAIVNIVLDPILIFGYFGMPKMGVAGAALATVIGQFVAMTIGIILNTTHNKEINVNMRGFRPQGKIIKKIYLVGFPSIIMQSITSIMTFLLNKILVDFSSTAVSVLGVYFKLQSFIFMPIFGLTNGLVPIIAYNFGAKHKDRIKSTLRLATIISVSYMAVGVLLFMLIPDTLLSLFSASENMLSIGRVALRLISLSFIPAGFCIIMISSFQALGHGFLSLIVSVCRQLLVLLPVAFIFSRVFGLDAIWLAFPIAEVVSLILTFIFNRRVHKNTIDIL